MLFEIGFFNPSSAMACSCPFFLSFFLSRGLGIERGANGSAGKPVINMSASTISNGSSSEDSNQFQFVQDLGLVPFAVRIEVQIVMWESQSCSEEHEAGFVQGLGILGRFRFLCGFLPSLLIDLSRFSSIFPLPISGPAEVGFEWRRDLREWVQDLQVDWQVVMFRWEWVELLSAR